MLLTHLLSKINLPYDLSGNENDEVIGVEIDSRLVKEGSIFVALKGQKVDGHDFILSAIENGAKAIVVEDCYEVENSDVVFIKTPEVHLFLIALLKVFYPNLPENIYGVTGTNGKTSIVEFIRQILGFLEKKSASIGTLGLVSDVDLPRKIVNSGLTTSDIVSLYKNLAILKDSDVDDVAIEVSSIGLEQDRIGGINLSVGSFSNFSVDHLDYHKNEEEYFRCKMLLFGKYLGKNNKAVLNSDIKEFGKIKTICLENSIDVVEYGKNANDLKILEINSSDQGQEVKVEIFDEIYSFKLSISGEFQVYNVLCALGNVLVKYDLSKDEIASLLSKFAELKSAQGRMDLAAQLSNNAKIFIDFAHTPDALENVLKLARNISKSRVFVLIGCGGNRDKTKRPVMGEVASNLADFVIVSDDNPRNEDASQIRTEIILGIRKDNFTEISPRELAIKEAIAMLGQDDILILTGKGHEKYQIIGDQKHDFDEVQIVQNAISKISQN